MHKGKIWTYRGLVGRSELRDQIALGLQCMHRRHFNAGRYQKAPSKVQAQNVQETATLLIHASTKTIRGWSASPDPSRYLPKIIQQRNKRNSTYHRKHFVLCTGGWHHSTDGPQFYCKQANARHNEHNGKSQTSFGLPATHPDATIWFRASDMVLNVHSDAFYLSETKAHSCMCGHFFMGWSPKDGDPIRLNGAFFTLCTILWFVVASAAKAKLGALFLNC